MQLRKFKSCGSSSMKQHQTVSSEGKKTSPDFSNYADGMKKNWKPWQLAKASILSLLSFSGSGSDWHSQTAERPSLWQTGMWNHTSLSGVTLVWSPLEYITRCHHLHLPPLCVRENPYMHSIYSTRANRAHFMAEQRPIWLAQPAAAEVNSDRMDGSVRGRNGRIVLHWRRNWLCSLG